MHPTQGLKYPWGNALTKFAFQTTSTLCSKFANQSKRNSSEHESVSTYPRGIQRQPQAAAISAQDTTMRRFVCTSCSLQLHFYSGFTISDWLEHFSQLSSVHLMLPTYKYFKITDTLFHSLFLNFVNSLFLKAQNSGILIIKMLGHLPFTMLPLAFSTMLDSGQVLLALLLINPEV